MSIDSKLELKNRLAKINKLVSLENAMYMYVKYIIDFLANNPNYFFTFCDSYGLTDEEYLGLLSNPSMEKISLYDQMASSIDKINKEKAPLNMVSK